VNRIILPGGTIGVLGGGQLGRMMALAARRMGYRIHTFAPGFDTPASQVADMAIDADYEDLDAIRTFAADVDVITFEFENVSTAATDAAAELVPIRPSGASLHITQQRAREKAFLGDLGLPVAPFARVQSLDELAVALGVIGLPAIVKTAAFGYDGKGQHRITAIEEAEPVWALVGHQEAIVERVVDFAQEMSVVAARGLDGAVVDFGAIENVHVNSILDLSVAPARVPPELARQAAAMTRRIMHELAYVGVLCVEFFVTADGTLLINEIAPRPHNSGHYSIDACVTSQFEQQARAVCGLPLGSTAQPRPAAMVNLLGDLWADGEPDWLAALAVPGARLHLYGKSEARAGRKMGHITVVADTVGEAVERAMAARAVLQP
jgi:5-(carboxyamino)imidazole ribonucleotide synthase